MLAFIIRRLLQSAAVMLVVAFIAFALFNFVGDPVATMLGQDATPEDRANLRRDLGLDDPFYRQFASFVGNALKGEFGLSLRQGRKVSTLLKERIPATLGCRSPRLDWRCCLAFQWASIRRCDETRGFRRYC